MTWLTEHVSLLNYGTKHVTHFNLVSEKLEAVGYLLWYSRAKERAIRHCIRVFLYRMAKRDSSVEFYISIEDMSYIGQRKRCV